MGSTVDLDKLANEIGTEGQRADGAMNDLVKGMRDGFGQLAALIKGIGKAEGKPEGKPEPEEKGEDDDHAEPDGDEDGEEKGDGDGDEPDPGYLRKGEEFVDATEFVLGMDARLARLEKADREQKALISKLLAHQESLMAQNRQLAEVVAVSVAPLMKGVLDIGQRLGAAQGANAVTESNRAAIRAGLDAAGKAPTAVDGLDNAKLAVALRKGVIDDATLRSYRRTGKFHEDEAKNAETIKSIQAA